MKGRILLRYSFDLDENDDDDDNDDDGPLAGRTGGNVRDRGPHLC
jgi:hypothetical protein